MSKTLIIRGPQVVTMDESLNDFPSADILVRDGAILAVGQSIEQVDAVLELAREPSGPACCAVRPCWSSTSSQSSIS